MTSIPNHRSLRLLVTGGRGFVGAAVVRHLLGRGHTVHVLGPESPVALPAGATETIGSIEDAAKIDATIAQVRPDAVLHFAAFSAGPVGLTRSGEADPDRMLAVNVLGFRNLLEACVNQQVSRVIWTSSTVVLGRASCLDRRVDETAPRHPLVQYGLSKVLAEDLAQYYRDRYALETVGLRIPLMLGPGLWYHGAAGQILALIRQVLDGDRSPVTGPAGPFDAMHVADTGRLIEAMLATTRTLAPIYHVAGFTTDFESIARTLSALIPGPAIPVQTQAPAIVYPLVSQALVERDTGWRHLDDLRSTLLDMIEEQRSSLK